MVSKRLYLIDATAFCYRAFYALSSLSTSFGQPTNAIYGFLNMLNKILKKEKPEYLAACFDVSRNTWRLKKFSEYKIQRPAMAEGLSSQIPFIKEIVLGYGISVFEKEGFEADDLIATLAKKAKESALAVTIVSSDKDILQLVDEDTAVFSPYKDEGLLYDKGLVFERFGLSPQQIPDMLTLMGDAADNIPNVPGIGEATARNLVRDFGSIEGILKNVDEIKQEKIRESIKKNINLINLNRELVALDKDMDLVFDLDKLKVSKPNLKELFRLFKYLEFNKFLKELPLEPDTQAAMKIEIIKDEEAKNLVTPQGELFLYGQGLKSLVFSDGNKILRMDHSGRNLTGILEDEKVRKTGHDLKSLKVSLAKEKVSLEGLYFDTMLAGYLLNPSKPDYGLAGIAWDYLGKPTGAIPANEDSLALIIQLRQRLENELGQKGLLNLFNEVEVPLAGVLADMQICGIKLDLELLEKISKELEERLGKLIQEIYALCGCQFNLNSPKQLREVLFVKLKLPVVKKTKSGPSTDEEVLRKLAKGHKLADLLLEYRQLAKLKSTYIDTLPSMVNPTTGRLHTLFNQTATETGRLSSSSPNLQNIPIKTDIGSRIRQAIIASSKDNYLLSCDYSQIELRLLAHLSKDENLISSFKMDKDIHRSSAALIYCLEEKDISGPMREMAKRVNFGIIYGLSSFGLSKDLSISLDEAASFIDAYFLRYPKVKLYIQEQIERAKEDGFVTTLLGRRRYLPEINHKNQAIRQLAQRQAVNTPIQGSASDLIKLAMIQIHSLIKSKGLKSKMILQIHDELVFDSPGQELGALAELVKDRMENVLELVVPIRVQMKKGRNWLEMEGIK